MNVVIVQIATDFKPEENSVLRKFFGETEAEPPVKKSTDISTPEELEKLLEAVNQMIQEYDDNNVEMTEFERITILEIRRDIKNTLEKIEQIEQGPDKGE